MTVMTAIRSAETEEAKNAFDRIDQARALLPVDAALARFFDALYSGAVPDDVLRARADQLASLAMMLHADAGKRAKGSAHVVALDHHHETVLVGINDDRPFLFDSALQAALADGARIRAAFHPVMDLDGTRTSAVALVCDALTGEVRDRLIQSLRDTFAQGALAVRDWQAMLARLAAARGDLAKRPPHIAGKEADIAEDLAFLDWLADNHFTFLGARDYRLEIEDGTPRLEPLDISGLGALADAAERVLRRSSEPRTLSREVLDFLNEPEALIVTKSSSLSLVHRRV